MEAYDLYLHGRALSQQDPSRMFESIGYFERATAKDPSFAPAYAALASVYALRSIQFVLDHPAGESSTMRDAAGKAIQLDPLLAEAHDALGMSYARDGQWEEAEKSFLHAIELDPNRSTTYDDFGTWFLWVLGRNEEAVKQLRLAERLDPVSANIHVHLGLVLISAGRYDDAAAVCLELASDNPRRNLCLARARFGQRKIDDAIHLLTSGSDLLEHPEARGFLGYYYARAARRREAATMAAVSDYPNEQALIFAGLGDKDRTFEALDRMAAVGAQRVGIHLNHPELASVLRGDPRLPAFRQRVGLPR